jgi:hypothetical protein
LDDLVVDEEIEKELEKMKTSLSKADSETSAS